MLYIIKALWVIIGGDPSTRITPYMPRQFGERGAAVMVNLLGLVMTIAAVCVVVSLGLNLVDGQVIPNCTLNGC
jgi:hypothetical protein